jgi:hypothetical protein
MRDLAVILIIAHKAELTGAELESLRQCYKVLGNFPIQLVCPEGLDVSAYKQVNKNAQITFIDPVWQSTYRNFNLLKMDKLLYRMFSKYEYILFYELDAWVFKDELQSWCEKGYDYIGAPWFEGEPPTESSAMMWARNGGFSLRKVSTLLRIAKRIDRVKKFRKFWYSSKLQAAVRFEKLLSAYGPRLKIVNSTELPKILYDCYELHEDHYWADIVASVFADFHIAPVEEAIQFSFEVNPALLYKMNHHTLPFGCHAWEKYDPAFWKEFIAVPSLDSTTCL